MRRGIEHADEEIVDMRRLALWLCIVLVAGAGIAVWARGRIGQGADPADRQIVRVERGAVELTVSADGTLKPLTTVIVKSYAGGQVDVLAVDVGDRVRAGDLIAKIDPTDSLTTYEQARADLDAAEAKLSESRPSLSQV
jgi:macrolide-specific efflux system membrane fusion protein